MRAKVLFIAFVLSLLCLGIPRQARAAGVGPSVGSSIQHKIQSGETLWGISGKNCGDPFLYGRIASENGIKNPALIYAGTIIMISCAKETAKNSGATVNHPVVAQASNARKTLVIAPSQMGIQSYVLDQASLFGIDPQVVNWIVSHESRYHPNAIGDGGQSRGAWQISRIWHPEVTDRCAFDIKCSTQWALKRIKLGNINEWTSWRFRRKLYHNAPTVEDVMIRKTVFLAMTPKPSASLPNKATLVDFVPPSPEPAPPTFASSNDVSGPLALAFVSAPAATPAPVPDPTPAPIQPAVAKPVGTIRAYRIPIDGLTPRIYPAYLLSHMDHSGNWKRKKTFVEVEKKGDALFAYLPFKKPLRPGSEIDFDLGGTGNCVKITSDEVRTAEPVSEALPTPKIPKKAYGSLDAYFPPHRGPETKAARIILTYGVPIAMGFKFGGPIGLVPVGMSLGARFFSDRGRQQLQTNAQEQRFNQLEIENIELKKQMIDLQLKLTMLTQGTVTLQDQPLPDPEDPERLN